MTVQHPHAELSAFLDDALDPAAQAAVDGHLVACAVCRAHVAELRATRAFLQMLPDPVPSRGLVPRLGVPAWLAPLRTLMTLASGAAVFLFIASSLVSNITFLASGGATTSARESSGDAAANAQAPAAARPPEATPAPAPAASPQTGFALGPTASAAPAARDTLSTRAGATPEPKVVVDQSAGSSAAPGVAVGQSDARRERSVQAQRSPLVNPWLWLAVAIFCGAAAIALHRRLRASV